jgi:predicted ArsR family transcriptional regulator
MQRFPGGRSKKAPVRASSQTDALLGSTRARILSELCGRSLTAQELAERFAISSNAVHLHLAELRKARLVRYHSERRGVGKPVHVFELAPEGKFILSRAYAPALSHVLGAARALGHVDLEEMLRAAGRKLARETTQVPKNAGLRSRLEACATLLTTLGGSPRLEEQSGALRLRSDCCPLASVVSEEPVVCKFLEGLSREIIGRDVEERCDRSHQPHCLFVIPATGGADKRRSARRTI